MGEDIELYKKTNRDLLVALVTSNNTQNRELRGINKHLATLNSTVSSHGERIAVVEERTKRRAIGTGSFVATVSGTIIYLLGRIQGWWPM